jgi:energy-coupling factor transport system substrate-specific component
MVIFAMLGTLMFCSKIAMEALPNVHLLGALTMVYTIVYRYRALIPVYIYVILNGAFAGFNLWWVPYLYIWTILWGITMLLPRQMPKSVAAVVYPLICGIHGFAFGTLYAPAQALMFGLDFKGMLAWIVAGLPFDLIHGAGNFAMGLLILPLSNLLGRLASGLRIR